MCYTDWIIEVMSYQMTPLISNIYLEWIAGRQCHAGKVATGVKKPCDRTDICLLCNFAKSIHLNILKSSIGACSLIGVMEHTVFDLISEHALIN